MWVWSFVYLSRHQTLSTLANLWPSSSQTCCRCVPGEVGSLRGCLRCRHHRHNTNNTNTKPPTPANTLFSTQSICSTTTPGRWFFFNSLRLSDLIKTSYFYKYTIVVLLYNQLLISGVNSTSATPAVRGHADFGGGKRTTI